MGLGIVSNFFKKLFGGNQQVGPKVIEKPFQLPLPNLITPADLEAMFNHAIISDSYMAEAQLMANRIRANRSLYEAAEAATHVNWKAIGAMHARECGCNTNGSLADGSDIPHGTLVSEMISTLKNRIKYNGVPTSLGQELYFCECHNGLGYRKLNIFSPYLWAGTQFYKHGKYTSDGVYDVNDVDHQIGVVPILMLLKDV